MEEQEQVITPEEKSESYNVKPRFVARILSALVDIFIIFLAGFGIYQLEMSTPISNEYHRLRDELITIIDDTKLDTKFGYKLYEDDEKYLSYYQYGYKVYSENDETSEHYQQKYVVANVQDPTNEVKEAYQTSIKNNATYQDHYITFKAINYGLTMLAVGSVELVLIFVVPLFNKRRATIGRYVALTTLISTKEVKAKWWQVLLRFLFVLIIETALPLFYLSEFFTLILVGGINLIVTLISRQTSRTLRDYVSFTRIIDKNSFKPINEQ